VAEFFTGTAWSLPTPLTIQLASGSTRFLAHYSTRPFSDAPYYSYRLSEMPESGAGVELEMVHHKLYLENPRPPIETFQVSHGYNLPMVSVVDRGGGWHLRVGFGLVVGHPEGRIDGRDISDLPTTFGGGYHIAGWTMQVATGRWYPLTHGRTTMVASPEVKLTASWARIHFPGGVVTVPNAALHILGGIGAAHCS
jgi:hypothetical protein